MHRGIQAQCLCYDSVCKFEIVSARHFATLLDITIAIAIVDTIVLFNCCCQSTECQFWLESEIGDVLLAHELVLSTYISK